MSCGANAAPSAISAGGLAACGGSCVPQSPARRTLLVQRFSATEAANTKQINVDFSSIPQRDSKGRFAHLCGVRIRGTYRFTLADASTSAVNGRDMLAIYSQIFLRDISGWIYAGGIDGRDIRDDMFARTAGYVTPEPTAIAVNAGAGTYDRTLDLEWAFTRNDKRGPHNFDGLIPLAALAKKSDALTFQIAGSVPGMTYTDVAFTGFQSPGLTVMADVLYLPSLVAPRPWQIETYEQTETSGALRHSDRMHEYAVIRHKAGDNGGELLDDYGMFTVIAEGDVLINGLSDDELVVRDEYVMRQDQLLAWAAIESGTDQLPYGGAGSDARMFFIVPPARTGQAMASGHVGWSVTSRTRTSTRFLHRTQSCHSPNRLADLALASGCPGDFAPMSVTPQGTPAAPSADETVVLGRAPGPMYRR